MNRLPLQFYLAARRWSCGFSRHVLAVSITRQQQVHFKMKSALNGSPPDGWPEYALVRRFVISTSRFGISQISGSNCTPLGLHRVVEKIGNGWPAGTVFKARQPIGYTWKGMPDAKITSRILWLEGLETGFNRGGNVDSHQRYIYIHGTGDETTLGRPASCGCIHLAANDLIPLFNEVPSGTLVWIEK